MLVRVWQLVVLFATDVSRNPTRPGSTGYASVIEAYRMSQVDA